MSENLPLAPELTEAGEETVEIMLTKMDDVEVSISGIALTEAQPAPESAPHNERFMSQPDIKPDLAGPEPTPAVTLIEWNDETPWEGINEMATDSGAEQFDLLSPQMSTSSQAPTFPAASYLNPAVAIELRLAA